MTQFLPPNLLALFAPRDPIPFLPPPDKLPHEKKSRGYVGVGGFLNLFEDPKDTPPPTRVETREERLERRRREKAEQVAYKLEREIATWDPQKINDCTEDPFKTLFVARVNYDSSESKLRREFEVFGPIKKIVMVNDSDSAKPRGYAFIEYQHEKNMHAAYKNADGKKIDGKRVLVDVERSRTVKGWLPRRLGGGLGGTRRGGPDVNIKHSGREDTIHAREQYRMERERDDRDRRERDRFEQPVVRRRSRSRDRRERERSRHRSRSREQRVRKRRSRDREIEDERRGGGGGGGGGGAEKDRREKDRGDKEKKRKRSKSRDRDRSERKREKRDRERGDRDRDRKERKPEFREGDIKIKEEPVDDYPDYLANFGDFQSSVKYEDGEETKFRPQENPVGENGSGGAGGQSYSQEEGEYDESQDYN